MSRQFFAVAFGALLALSSMGVDLAESANPCNPCAARNPCAGNPCAAKNPCAGNPCAAKNPCGGNPCNPCAGGSASARWEGVMISGKIVSYKGGYLSVRARSGKVVRLHVTRQTRTLFGRKSVSAASLKPGSLVSVSTQMRKGYYKANFIYARAGGGGNPCGGNPCGGNPCNPCAGK